MARQFEYRREVLPADQSSQAGLKQLNDLGAEGWRLVQIIVPDRWNAVIAWLMREVE